VDDEAHLTRAGSDSDGPGHAALDLLYRFVAAVELTPTVAVHAIDRDGIICFWNNTCSELFGILPDQALGQPLARLVSHREREGEFGALLEQVWMSGQAAPPCDWQVDCASGKQLWLYSTVFPAHRDGAPQQVFCMDIDVSSRKREEMALLQASGNFRLLYERSLDAIVLIEGENIIDANPAALRLFRCERKSRMLGKTLLDFSPATQPSGEASLIGAAAIAAQTFRDGNLRHEWRYQLGDGSGFWADVLLTSVTLDHHFLSYAVIRDISQRKASEQHLAMAAQVFEHCRDAILILDQAYLILAVNQAHADITGFAHDEVIGTSGHELHAETHDGAFYQRIWDEVAAHGHWKGEIWSVRKSGQRYPASVALTAIRDGQHGSIHFMAVLADITDRRRNEEYTRHLAEHDFLTDLPNRVLLIDRLHQALAAARRKHSKVAVMFLDLDRFKLINDNFGHHVGDLLLKEVALRLARCVRGVDTVSRQGGDEFIIILADIGGEEQAAHVAASVMQAVALVTRVGEIEVNIGTSIGISIYPGDGEDVDTLLKHADVAMYHAKQNGRNEYRFFSPEMNAQVVERIGLENKLRHALAEGQFELEYQPEIDIGSGRTIAVEALIRWRHPELGLLLPDQFIPVAEACGLMVPIGEWVLQQACARARAWRDEGFPVVVAVNLSNAQFLHSKLVDFVGAALERSGLPPQYLELEITEGVIMSGDTATISTLNRLHANGVQLAVDDFGTGYSSMGDLRHFPLSKLKIDRSFVGDITGRPDQASIIPAIIALARSLKLKVTAEGVETAEQLRYLEQHGCDEYQGYYANMTAGKPGVNA
jgi:diguanylate cyclase (GGDEF)-like protein/PAS domain S-box-containing protein